MFECALQMLSSSGAIGLVTVHVLCHVSFTIDGSFACACLIGVNQFGLQLIGLHRI